jgi:hypothetical protein
MNVPNTCARGGKQRVGGDAVTRIQPSDHSDGRRGAAQVALIELSHDSGAQGLSAQQKRRAFLRQARLSVWVCLEDRGLSHALSKMLSLRL